MSEIRVERLAETEPCSRCGERLVMSTQVPVGAGKVVMLELCSPCDTGEGAAGWVLALLVMPEEQRTAEDLAEATLAWLREGMAARGWRWIPGQRHSAN